MADKIRLLPEVVANQIAAGEVVNRPSSVVKEMMENAIDAGATHIRIEIERAGSRLISVSDNGSGMDADDALLCIEPQCGAVDMGAFYDALPFALTGAQKRAIGEAVGIIAAQSIGEPGTQLTMRTFHTGGVAGGDDITQGLPRVEELFEARKPKHPGILAEITGVVHIAEEGGQRKITITDKDGMEEVYAIPYGAKLAVTEGQEIEKGDRLTEGSLNPHDIIRISGVRATQRYLVQQVLGVYKSQGVEINDKHIEVMVRQMMRKVRIDEAGDTTMLPGEYVDIGEFEEQNSEMLDRGLQPAEGHPILLGITKASLATDSFLSAASFQETTRVLTDAAIKGKVDPLLGLKENVIIGKLIPAGTGMSRYRDVKVKYNNVPTNN